MMKKTSFLINTSRGPIINENDLVEALKDEKIAGVGLDVYNKEPLPQDHKLRFFPNALLRTLLPLNMVNASETLLGSLGKFGYFL